MLVPYNGCLFIKIPTVGADKPPLEELTQFLEYQLPRQWAPAFNDFPLGPRRKKKSSPALQFTLLGPKLYVNTIKVNAELATR